MSKTRSKFLCKAGHGLLYLCLGLGTHFHLAAQSTPNPGTSSDNPEIPVANPALQQPEQAATRRAEDWLMLLSQASQTLNYQASFVLLTNGVASQPYRWRHGVMSDGTVREQMSLLNGPGREMVRVEQVVSYFEPNVPPYSLRSDVINGPIPGTLLKDPLSLTECYDFVLVGRSRVAGRLAQQIRVVSRDKSRFGYNLWLDNDTGLLLKMDMSDMRGQLLEQLQVTELTVTDSPDQYLVNIDPGSMPEVVNVSQMARESYHWQLSDIPLGMEVVRRDIHRLPMTGQLVGYSMLSDGLVDVSVYIQPIGQAIEGEVLLRHESNTLLTRNLGDLQITVVGKLPAKTANAIANSVVLVK